MVEEKIKEEKTQVIEPEPSISYLVARTIELLCYLVARTIELLCIGAFVFGFLWNGTEVMNLTTPQFMMLYGGSGAVISEVVARIFKKKQKKVNKNWVTVSLVLSISISLVVGVMIMYETKAFWGKESNSNINTLNVTMNFASANNLFPVITIVIVVALVICLLMTTRCGFG